MRVVTMNTPYKTVAVGLPEHEKLNELAAKLRKRLGRRVSHKEIIAKALELFEAWQPAALV